MQRLWRPVAPFMAAVLALGLAGVPAAAQEASSSPSAAPSPDALNAEAINAALAELTSPEGLAAAALEVAATDRELLAAIDPELPAVMAELDAMAAEELAGYLASAVPEPEASPEPGESLDPAASAAPDASPEPAPEAVAGTRAFLSAVPRRPPDQGRRFAQGGSYLTAVGQVIGAVGRFVADQKPDKGSSSDPGSAFTQSRTETVGGFPVSVSTRYQITNARVRDEVTFGVELTERYAIPSRTPGQPPIEVTDTGSATLHIDLCPDEDGTIIARADTHATVTASGNGLAYHVVADADDTATATVSDQAAVASIAHAVNASRHATGDLGVFSSGGDGETDSHLEGSTSWTADGTGARSSSTSFDVTTADGASEADIRAWALTGGFAAAVDDAAIAAASQVWRNGRCLQLKADPPGKTVDPGSETTIKVTIHHKAYDDEVKRNVKATLAGPRKVDPLDSPVMAPADFKYTATSEQQGEGVITFRSVSNRGIAELTEKYKVDLRLLLDTDGTVSYTVGPVSGRGTVKGRGLVVTLIPGDQPDAIPGVKVTGDVQVLVQASSPGCSGRLSKTYAVHSGLNASAKVVGEGEGRQLSVLIRPANPSATATVRVQCDGEGVTFPIPISILFPNFTLGGELVIPIGGGSAELSANVRGVRSKFTFTLRQERPR